EFEPARRFALGLAWFGLTVGALVVLLRPEFFRARPDQVTSQRYVPWVMMLWTGLGLLFVLRRNGSARTTAWVVIAVAALFAPSQVWTGRYAFKLRHTAEVTAVGAAVGVLDRDFPLVETEWDDLATAVPLLRDAGKAMFAWPETKVLGSAMKDGQAVAVEVADLEVSPIVNRFDGGGCVVRFLCDSAPASLLLLLDGAGIARGIAIEVGPDGLWQGWLRGGEDAARLQVALLR
ncbi:MAG: hypothetical protein KDC98_26530, partial [Planctomycetes bacterium]|nr:hypothetical protein [Planctomycetota bacterium]